MSLGHDVVTEAGFNWYLHNINICSLLKKLTCIAAALQLANYVSASISWSTRETHANGQPIISILISYKRHRIIFL
jgi:hypothetical protein